MRKEVKIAIFAIITIVLAIWGYKYLRGFNLLNKTIIVTAVFERVDGLRTSTPIYIRGLQVGLVSDIRQNQQNLSEIVVEMHLDPGTRVPKTATAEIISSVMAGASINLVFEGECSGDACVKSGDSIRGVTKGVLASFATPEEVKDYVDVLNDGLQKVIDTLEDRIQTSEEIQASKQDIRAILSNLRSTTERMDRMMANSSGSIQNTMKNLETVTTTLRESNQQIKAILANADSVSGDLKRANFAGLSADARATFQKLQSTVATSDRAINNLDAILASIRNGESTMGKLLSDKQLGEDIEKSIRNMNLLLQDIRLHPERYRRILSKKEMPYEPPTSDPALKD